MPVIYVPFELPADILAAINGGDLTRHGGIVRDRAGAIVIHLKDAFQYADTPRAAAQGAADLSRPLKVIAVGLGAAVLTTAGAAVFVAATRGRKRGARVQASQCVRNSQPRWERTCGWPAKGVSAPTTLSD